MTKEQSAVNENTYKAIFEACEEGIITVNRQGRILMANQAGQNMFGYTLDEMRQLSVEHLIPFPLRERHIIDRAHFTQNPQPRKMGHGRDLLALRKDDSEFPVEISLNTAELNGETVTVAFIIDITERKKIEAALKNSEEQLILYASQLEKRVKERTEKLDDTISALEKANKKLEDQIRVRKKAEEEAKRALERERELNELKSRFVSMASHEFRTPLSTMLSSASLIDKYTAPGTEEKRRRHVEKIKSSIHNLTGILNDFLSLSKLEEGKILPDLQEVKPDALIEEVISEMITLRKPDQKIKFEVHGKPRPIQSDPKILTNVVINLISNAVKYSGEGTTVHIQLTYRPDHIHLEISDQGIGIPQEEQKYLFERFFRGKNAVNIQGTGLGLHIVKKYIDMLSGSITCQSKLNEGSTFSIHLPNQTL